MSHCDHDREHNRNRPLYLCAVQNPEDGRLLLVDAESGRRVSNVAVIAIEQDAQDPDACRINVDHLVPRRDSLDRRICNLVCAELYA